MDHPEALELLAALALNACEQDEVAAIEDHVAGCAECQPELARLRDAAAWLGADAIKPPAAELRDRVLSRAKPNGLPRQSHD